MLPEVVNFAQFIGAPLQSDTRQQCQRYIAKRAEVSRNGQELWIGLPR